MLTDRSFVLDGERFVWGECDECGADDWMLAIDDIEAGFTGYECPGCGSTTETSRRSAWEEE